MAVSSARQDPPAVARQRVRRALRSFRDATPWSQSEVASKLGWSLSKMQRIEGGEVAISQTDLRALLGIYGVGDQQVIESLLADARTARRQRYVTAPDYREHLTPALLELMQFEERAVSIKTYQPMSYPGLLQTPGVAEVILAAWRGQLTPEQRRVRYEARLSRRQNVLERMDSPRYDLILDESVIKRRFGKNIKITAEQLEDLAEVAQRPNIHLRLVPLIRGEYTPAFNAFQILRLSDDDGDAVLYRETHSRDELVKDAGEISFYASVFDDLWAQSFPEPASLRAVQRESASLRAELDLDEATWRQNS